MKEIKGNLITLAKNGEFDIIIHGCNCFCRMGSGLAPQIKENFPDAWKSDLKTIKGDFNKLGNYSIGHHKINNKILTIINAYTQYGHNPIEKPLDYEALTLVLRKINFNFSGLTIGVPQIGAGLAGGDWNKIKNIIETELKDMKITIVYYEKN